MQPLLYYVNETANKQGTCTVIQEGGHSVPVNKWNCKTKFYYCS